MNGEYAEYAGGLYKDGVRQRDISRKKEDEARAEMSDRHLKWGRPCAATDFDFLLFEWTLDLPCGVVEYKKFNARYVDLLANKIQTVATLCNGFSNGALPFLIAWYWPYNWSFYVVPVNAAARGFFKENIRLTEQEYVSGLYRMRGRMVERHILSELNRQKPPSDGIQPRHGYGREHP